MQLGNALGQNKLGFVFRYGSSSSSSDTSLNVQRPENDKVQNTTIIP